MRGLNFILKFKDHRVILHLNSDIRDTSLFTNCYYKDFPRDKQLNRVFNSQLINFCGIL